MSDDLRTRRAPASISPLSWLVAIAGPVVVALALVPLRGDIRTSNVSLVLVLVVVAAAVLGGRLSGAIAVLVSVAAFDFFFTHPYGSLAIDGRDDLETAVLLLVVGLVVGELVVRARRSEQRAAESRAEVVHVRRLAELAAGGESRGRLIGIVQGELVSLLPVRECRFEHGASAHDLPEITHKGVLDPGIGASGSPRPRGRIALPVFGDGRPVGRFVLDLDEGASGIAMPPEDRALAVALADQLGAVLVHQFQS